MVKFFKNGFINVDQIYAMLFGPLSLIIFGGQALRLQMEVHDWIYEGQARGCGPKTHKRGCKWWPLISGLVYSQTIGHTSLPWVPNKRSGYCLCKDTS